jgi:hypothetical protein
MQKLIYQKIIIMKTIYFPVLLIFLTLVLGCKEKQDKLTNLKIMEENYPRAFFFRASERTMYYDNYEEWEDTYDDLMGFIGQALPYQRLDHIPGDLDKNPEYYRRFKKDNPDQMILMHLATNAHDPRAQPIDIFDGHWLYYNGATILSDVPAKGGTMEIKVSDAKLFHLNIGFTNDRAEDIGLCTLDENGKPNWNEAEQVQLVAVDTVNNLITVDRCQYGTAPRVFKAGLAYAASHVWNGPWNDRTHLAWSYNYSTLCPPDSEGKLCSERLAKDYLGKELGENGLVPTIDGLAFDVVWQKPRVSPRQAKGRLPDFNADGIGDNYNTDSTYLIGVTDFFRDLREELGEGRIITSDGMSFDNQRAFGILNGMESEGFPRGNDPHIKDWSGGINRLLFWDQNGRKPVFSYVNYKYFRNVDRSSITINYPRLVMAASCLANTGICMNLSPGDFVDSNNQNENNKKSEMQIWDELVMGKAKQLGWLGKPLTPAMHLAQQGINVLDKMGVKGAENLLQSLKGDDVGFTLEDDGSIRMQSFLDDMRIQLENIPCKDADMTVFITARSRTREGFPSEYARLLIASANQPGLPFPDALQGHFNEDNRFASFVNEQEFTSFFNFSDLESETVNLEILVEGGDPVWITGIEIYAQADAMYREFQNGLVLANPNSKPITFNLGTLFPEQTFKRIEGSKDQDPVHNDGSLVDGTVTLQGKDALFLIKN